MSQELHGCLYYPITAKDMVDPVTDREGNSYEHVAIEDWIQRQQTSPITRKPLRPHILDQLPLSLPGT
jgi:hypothetical protein